MAAHRIFTDRYAARESRDDRITDPSSAATLQLDRDDGLLVLGSGSHTRTLPASADQSPGTRLTILSNAASGTPVVRDAGASANIDGSGNNTGSFSRGDAAVLMVIYNDSGVKIWRAITDVGVSWATT